MTTPRLLTIALMIGLLAFSTGCDEAEDALNNIPTPADDPAVQLVAAEGVKMAQSLLAALPQVMAGGLGAKSIDDAYYDESCSCWLWSVYEGNENSNPYWARNTSFQATFYNGETPQMELEGADRVAMVVTFFYEWNEFNNDQYSSKSVMVTANLETTEMGTKVTVTTQGTGTGYVSGGTGNYSDDEWDGFYEEFDVAVDVDLPVPGCPSGLIDFLTEEATFHMGFNGSTSGSWSYKFGDTTLDSGNFPIGCGAP